MISLEIKLANEQDVHQLAGLARQLGYPSTPEQEFYEAIGYEKIKSQFTFRKSIE